MNHIRANKHCFKSHISRATSRGTNTLLNHTFMNHIGAKNAILNVLGQRLRRVTIGIREKKTRSIYTY